VSGARCQRQGLTDTEPGFNTVLRHMRNPELTPCSDQLACASATPLAEVGNEGRSPLPRRDVSRGR
jgi:hypothetical protein